MSNSLLETKTYLPPPVPGRVGRLSVHLDRLRDLGLTLISFSLLNAKENIK
jgi:hypothetical protein